MTELATLTIKVDASGAIRVVDQFGNSTEQAAKKTTGLERGVKALAGVFAAGVIGRKFLDESSQAQAAQAQLAAVLRSTGGAAGQTADALNDHAAALQRVTTYGDDAVTQAQALLLTFTKIGGETFPQATEALLDVATAMGGDLKGAAVQVGKALNDPILGITALSRSGIQFSDSQKEMIRGFVETNQLAKAQGVILKELETQFGGSAKAARDTLGGAITSLNNSIGDLFEMDREEAAPLIGAIEFITDSVTDLGLTWKVTFAEMQVAALKLTDVLDQRFLGGLERLAGSAIFAGTKGAFGGGLLARGAQRSVDTDALVAVLDAYVLGLQKELAARGAGRAGGGTGGPGAPPPALLGAGLAPTSELGRYLDWMGAVREETIAQAAAYAKVAPLLENGTEGALNFATVINGLPPRVDALTESARVFQEQSQLALSRFASDFLKDGFKSVGRFWDSFAQLGRDAIGNIFAREFMNRIGNQISDAISGSGIGGLASLGIGGALISGFLNQRQESQRIAEAMEESARSIALFARKAGDADLTAEQRALRDILDERDQKARTAVSSSGLIRGFSGGFDEAIAQVQRLMNAGGIAAQIFGPLYEQLLALQEASEANAEAVRESIAALEQEAALRRASTLEAFRDSLALSGASTLSPVQQLAEAQRQYDAILGLAQGGDQSAIDSLPETARTLLDAARSVFASGTRYADVFGRVNADVDDIINSLRNTPGGADPLNEDPLGFEPTEIEFAALIESNASIRTGVGEMQSAIVAEQQAQVTVLQGGFTSMVTQLQAAVARLDSIDRSVRETNSLRTPDTTTLVY